MSQNHICYLCFSANTGFIGRNLDFDTDIYVCNDCGLIQNDFVSSPYLDHYYHKKYREVRREAISDSYLKFMSLRSASQHEFIVKNLPEALSIGAVLDIGASAGKLLETFKPAAKLFAVESDTAMAAYMEKSGVISVIDESVLFDEENQGRFDLVTLSHVFEHINNPLEYLYQLQKVVTDGGYVFMEVPNEPVHLIVHHVKKKKKGVGHLFDYTVDTLRQMIDKSGLFEMVALTTYSVSVADYLKGASIRNFGENKTGDGIHIRCLLRKLESASRHDEYRYVDAVLQGRYRKQLLNERRIEMVLHGIEKVKESLAKVRGLAKQGGLKVDP
jgi:2-polyprenyl-3-methyl-5-hydroxy-6-metoxy-1,4-benzoquinol methylase